MNVEAPFRRPSLDLLVERRGARSVLARQYATYPFHIARPFRLDAVPAVTTLYIQSSSGGLYAQEDLFIRVHVATGAALHLTTQAATLVHGHLGRPARIRAEFVVEDGACLFYTPDPQILLPGSAAESTVSLRIEGSGAAFLSDGFLFHDPGAANGRPEGYTAIIEVELDGAPVLSDRQIVSGADLAAQDGPLHGHRVCGTAMILSRDAPGCAGALAAAMPQGRAISGCTRLPGDCGLGVRLLASDGTAFAQSMQTAFAFAFRQRFGMAPAPRRK